MPHLLTARYLLQPIAVAQHCCNGRIFFLIYSKIIPTHLKSLGSSAPHPPQLWVLWSPKPSTARLPVSPPLYQQYHRCGDGAISEIPGRIDMM